MYDSTASSSPAASTSQGRDDSQPMPMPSFLAPSPSPRQRTARYPPPTAPPRLVMTDKGALTVSQTAETSPRASHDLLSPEELCDIGRRFELLPSSPPPFGESQESQEQSSQEDNELLSVVVWWDPVRDEQKADATERQTRKLLRHVQRMETMFNEDVNQYKATITTLKSSLETSRAQYLLLEREATVLSQKVRDPSGTSTLGGRNSSTETDLLRSDVAFYSRRLRESEEVVASLSDHLRSLRAHLVSSGPLIAYEAAVDLPESATQRVAPRKRKTPLLGDAQAEHLILAGKQQSHIRRIWRVSVDQAVRHRAKEIIESTDSDLAEVSRAPTVETAASHHHDSREQTPPLTAAAAASLEFDGAPDGDSSTGFVDLLTAASSLLDRHSVPPRSVDHSHGPIKRLRVSHSPPQPPPLPAQPVAGPSNSYGPRYVDSSSSSLNSKAKASSSGTNQGSGGTPTSALDLLASTSQSLAKAKRSPYIKWSVEEDGYLCRAVIQAGQRWDQVANLVPTRSYHQCRQRWLRGLRSGNALPDELKHYEEQVKQAVAAYEATRNRKVQGVPATSSANSPPPPPSASASPVAPLRKRAPPRAAAAKKRRRARSEEEDDSDDDDDDDDDDSGYDFGEDEDAEGEDDLATTTAMEVE